MGSMRVLTGKQYWMAGGLQAWTEGTTKVGRGVTAVPHATVDAQHVRLRYHDPHEKREGEVLLQKVSDVALEGRFSAGADSGKVSARLFENSEGVLLLGTWTDDEGPWFWMADLVNDESTG